MQCNGKCHLSKMLTAETTPEDSPASTNSVKLNLQPWTLCPRYIIINELDNLEFTKKHSFADQYWIGTLYINTLFHPPDFA